MQVIRFTLVITLLLLKNAYADIAPTTMYSKGIKAFTENKIQMVDEVVTVELYKDHALVTAEFNMTNHGEETTLEIGFPNVIGNVIHSLTDFTATVEGERRSVQVHPDKKANIYPEGEDLRFRLLSADWEWMIWNETFAAGESKKICVSYRQPPWLVPGGDLWNPTFHVYPRNRCRLV